MLFGTKRVTNLACSGAVTSQYGLIEQTFDDKVEVELQSRQLQKLVDGKEPPGLVLLTFGGNDIGFADIVAQCATSRDCQRTLGQAKINTISAVSAGVTSVYEQVDRQVNSPDVVARRGGRIAPIVVLPYVRLLPVADEDPPSNCFLGFSPEEVKYMNRLLNELNGTIHSAVKLQADAGRPFYYAEDIIDAFQPDHTICDSSKAAYGNTYKIKSFDTATTDVIQLALIQKFQPNARQEFIHPNAEGYAAEAQVLAGWAQRTPLRPVTGKPLSTSLSGALPLRSHPILGGVDIGVGQLQPAGGTITVQGSGFDPGQPVLIQLRSVPRTVATATADSQGTVLARTPIPYTTPMGSHHVVLIGTGPDGTFREQSFPVLVLPQLTGVALLALLAGSALVLFWGISGRSRRRGSVRNSV